MGDANGGDFEVHAAKALELPVQVVVNAGGVSVELEDGERQQSFHGLLELVVGRQLILTCPEPVKQRQPALTRFFHGDDAGEDIRFPFPHALHEPVPRRRGIHKFSEMIGVENDEHRSGAFVFLRAPCFAQLCRLAQQRLAFECSECGTPPWRGHGHRGRCVLQPADPLFEVRQLCFDGGIAHGRKKQQRPGFASYLFGGWTSFTVAPCSSLMMRTEKRVVPSRSLVLRLA
jgi:hypothetical protein